MQIACSVVLPVQMEARNAVSYTHLDVYKRQAPLRPKAHTYGPGEMVYLLGKPYPLRLQPGPKVEVRLSLIHIYRADGVPPPVPQEGES